MAHQIISLNLRIPVSVVPANDQSLPSLLRGRAGFVAKFNSGPPLSIPIEEGVFDIFAAYAEGDTEREACDNLTEAVETALRQAQQGDSPVKDAVLPVGRNQRALVRVDLLHLG